MGAATRLEVRWLAEHALGDVTITDVSAGTCAVGGPGLAAGVLLSRLTDPADRSGHRRMRCTPTSAPCRSSCCAAPPWASTAWSCAPPPTSVPRCGTCSGTRAPPSAWSRLGSGPVASLLVEAGHRGIETGLDATLTPAEAGLGHLVDPAKGLFLGRDAALAPPRRRLVTLALDDPGEVVLGDEPVLDGEVCVGPGRRCGGRAHRGRLARPRGGAGVVRAGPGRRCRWSTRGVGWRRGWWSGRSVLSAWVSAMALR